MAIIILVLFLILLFFVVHYKQFIMVNVLNDFTVDDSEKEKNIRRGSMRQLWSFVVEELVELSGTPLNFAN